MKKVICSLALCLILLAAFAGCRKRQEDITGEGSPLIPGAGRETSDTETENVPSESEPIIDAAPYVADAPMYRGTVIEREEEDGHLLLKLESPEGIDFGYRSILMQTGEETRAAFDLNEIQVGDHLEVFFSDRNDGLPPMILSAHKLAPAADTVYNGEIVRYEKSDNGRYLELRPFDSENTTIFHLSDDTQIYLNEELLVPGSRVNIYHRGILTRSLPPQGQALELRPYFEAAE